MTTTSESPAAAITASSDFAEAVATYVAARQAFRAGDLSLDDLRAAMRAFKTGWLRQLRIPKDAA